VNESAAAGVPTEIDTSRPHPARMYDYFIGGKNHFAADRETAAEVLRKSPSVRIAARENRAFLGRAVRYLAGEAGIRQFLDIGTGLPTTNNVHEVAQSHLPSARVVYVDNDPLVLAHARALLTSSPEGRTAYLHADLRDPAAILSDPVARDVLDFSQPIALMLVAILHFLPDENEPAKVIATLLDALPPGSYLAASHLTTENNPQGTGAGQRVMREAGIAMQKRHSDEFARLAFPGLKLVPPGVVLVSEWRPDVTGPRPTPAEVSCYGGVARKPLRVSARDTALSTISKGYVAPQQQLRKQSPELRGRGTHASCRVQRPIPGSGGECRRSQDRAPE
jgi:SAM-dependent methyltransferase